MLYTLINLLPLSHPQSCWETRPDSAMPGQAVSPQAVDTAPTDPIKKTQLSRPDTGSLSTQLSRRTHTVAHTQTHTPSASLFPFSPPLSDTLHTSAGRTAANYQLKAPLPSLLLPHCTRPLSFSLIKWFTIPISPYVTDRASGHPISQRKRGECSCICNNKGAWGGKE